MRKVLVFSHLTRGSRGLHNGANRRVGGPTGAAAELGSVGWRALGPLADSQSECHVSGDLR